MTPNSGQTISMAQIRSELGLSGAISLGGSEVRYYSFVPTGAISMSNCYAMQKYTLPVSTTNTFNMAAYATSNTGWDGVTPLKQTVVVAIGQIIGGNIYGSGAGLTFAAVYNNYSNQITLPANSKQRLLNNGIIVGAGGTIFYNGQFGTTTPASDAIVATSALTVENNGVIGGGGGAGGTLFVDFGDGFFYTISGGGGAGFNPGNGGGGAGATVYNGNAGIVVQYCGTSTPTQAQGGGPGQSGQNGVATADCFDYYSFTTQYDASTGGGGGLGGAGGSGPNGVPGTAPGKAVVGNSYITWTATGAMYGAVS